MDEELLLRDEEVLEEAPSSSDLQRTSGMRLWHPRNRRPFSDVWRFFERNSDQSKSCRVCNGIFSTTTSTGALRKHLQRHFGDQTAAVLTTAQHATEVRISPGTNTVTLSGAVGAVEPVSEPVSAGKTPKGTRSKAFVQLVPASCVDSILAQTSPSKRFAGPKTKSRVWKHFVRLANGRPQCRYCSKQYASTVSTSGLQRHIDRHILQQNVATAEELVYVSAAKGVKNPTHMLVPADADADDHFIRMLVQSHISPSEADRFMSTIYSSFAGKLLEPASIESALQKMFASKRESVMQFLDSWSSALSLSLEHWTSDEGSAFLIATVHLVTDKWKIIRVVISCVLLPNAADARAIRDCLTDICHGFDISSKILAIASGHPVVDEAVELFRAEVETESPRPIHPIKCVLKAFEKCVRPALNALETQCSALRRFLWTLINKRKSAELQHVAALMIHDFAEIQLDSEKYWVSTASMIVAAVAMRPVVDDFIIRNSTDFEPISAENWDALEAGVGLLSNFLLAAKDIEKTDYPPLSNVLPMVEFLIQSLASTLEAKDQIEWVAEAAAEMTERCRGLLATLTTDSYFLGTVLDPRHKLGTIPTSVDVVTFQEHMRTAFSTYIPLATVTSETGVAAGSSQSGSTPAESFMSTILKKTRDAGGQSQLDELDQYIQTAQEQPDVDPLEWWESHKKMYAALSLMAKDYLGIPATCEPSSQIVLKEDHVGRFRNRLDEVHLGVYVCLNSWINFEFV